MLSFVFLDDFKNLKVLDIKSKSKMKKYMKEISKDLGVKCSHCHDLDDKSIDNDEKEIEYTLQLDYTHPFLEENSNFKFLTK